MSFSFSLLNLASGMERISRGLRKLECYLGVFITYILKDVCK